MHALLERVDHRSGRRARRIAGARQDEDRPGETTIGEPADSNVAACLILAERGDEGNAFLRGDRLRMSARAVNAGLGTMLVALGVALAGGSEPT